MPNLSFDAQAWIFDRRARLPAGAAAAVARAVRELADLTAGDLWIEIGAGTGEIGAELAAAGADDGARYLGLDLSLSMLAVFRGKLRSRRGDRIRAATIQADGDRRWPLRGARARAIFLSRAAHLLRVEHLAAEILRASDPRGAILILGGVRREKKSVHAWMRRRMHRLLAEHGVEGRSSRRGRRRLFAALETHGGKPLPTRVAATWPVVERPADSLRSWRGVAGLAGRPVAEDLKDGVLHRLEHWARERWGDLDAEHAAVERYQLAAVRLGGEP